MSSYNCPDCGRDIGRGAEHTVNCPRGDGPDIPEYDEQLDRIEQKLDELGGREKRQCFYELTLHHLPGEATAPDLKPGCSVWRPKQMTERQGTPSREVVSFMGRDVVPGESGGIWILWECHEVSEETAAD